MKFRIEHTVSFNCIGVKSESLKPFSPVIGEMWQEVTSNGNFSKILNQNDTEFRGIHGFCEPQPAGFIYWIASASTKEAPEDMHKLTVPESTWFIMSGEGYLPDAIQNLWKESFEILSSSGYRQVQSTCIERYLAFQEDMYSKFELWIAVEKVNL